MEIVTEVMTESRQDRGLRDIHLAGAPILTYTHTRYRFRQHEHATEERAWQPEVIRIRWSQGKLAGFSVRGHRIKKDGKVGRMTDKVSYRLAESGWVGREDYANEELPAPDWVVQIVDAHKDNPPPFDPPSRFDIP